MSLHYHCIISNIMAYESMVKSSNLQKVLSCIIIESDCVDCVALLRDKVKKRRFLQPEAPSIQRFN